MPFLIKEETVAGIVISGVGFLIIATILLSIYLTATDDPGIIPRNEEPPPDIVRNPGHPRDRNIYVQGVAVTIKYCETCKIWRPPRASHCSTCDNCVERFDHHCPWLGNDIGKRNYRTFFLFVVMCSLGSMLFIGSAVWHLILKSRGTGMKTSGEAFVDALRSPSAVNLFLIVYLLLALIFCGGLSVFHIYLMSRNITTAESFKRTWLGGKSPFYGRGLTVIKEMLFSKKIPSKIKVGYEGPMTENEEEIKEQINRQEELSIQRDELIESAKRGHEHVLEPGKFTTPGPVQMGARVIHSDGSRRGVDEYAPRMATDDYSRPGEGYQPRNQYDSSGTLNV